MNFPTIFQKYIDVLSKHRKELSEKVQLDLTQFRDIKKIITVDNENVTYYFNHVRLHIPRRVRPSHCIPRSLKDITITIHTDRQIVFKKNNLNFSDPFVEVGTFNFILDATPYISSWHLDRHSEPGIPSSLHPLYHLTFGGKHMENLDVDGEEKFGHSLIVRAPRISHPPMELLLSIDYVLQHYFIKDELDLLSDPNYQKIIHDLKTKFWKPYFLSLLKPYYNTILVDTESVNIDLDFANRVNGIYRQ